MISHRRADISNENKEENTFVDNSTLVSNHFDVYFILKKGLSILFWREFVFKWVPAQLGKNNTLISVLCKVNALGNYLRLEEFTSNIEVS